MDFTAVIEKSTDGMYCAYLSEEIPGYTPIGYGESVEQAKDDLFVAINEMKGMAYERGDFFPEIDNVTFSYDIPSFFNCFDWINISMFARKVGINESKLRAYKSGSAFPSEKTVQKILKTVRELGSQMAAASL